VFRDGISSIPGETGIPQEGEDDSWVG
jgi:hypothetical protein